MVVSQTSAEITQGLSDRDEIGADGMLFVFTRPTQPTFWMYHMKFDLDFIWLNETQVVDLHESVPAPANVGESDAGKIATVRPSESVTAVIEVPAGFIQERGIKRGDAWENVGSQSRGRW